MSKVPSELHGLWKLQYAPIERKIEKESKGKADMQEFAKKYSACSIPRKLMILDNVHADLTGQNPSIF